MIAATSFGCGNLTVDVGLLPLDAGAHALRLLVYASKSLAFTLRRRALASVRAMLPLVGQPLAFVRESLPLVGDPVSPGGEPLASSDLGLTPYESLLAHIKRGGPTFDLGERWNRVLGDHNSA